MPGDSKSGTCPDEPVAESQRYSDPPFVFSDARDIPRVADGGRNALCRWFEKASNCLRVLWYHCRLPQNTALQDEGVGFRGSGCERCGAQGRTGQGRGCHMRITGRICLVVTHPFATGNRHLLRAKSGQTDVATAPPRFSTKGALSHSQATDVASLTRSKSLFSLLTYGNRDTSCRAIADFKISRHLALTVTNNSKLRSRQCLFRHRSAFFHSMQGISEVSPHLLYSVIS